MILSIAYGWSRSTRGAVQCVSVFWRILQIIVRVLVLKREYRSQRDFEGVQFPATLGQGKRKPRTFNGAATGHKHTGLQEKRRPAHPDVVDRPTLYRSTKMVAITIPFLEPLCRKFVSVFCTLNKDFVSVSPLCVHFKTTFYRVLRCKVATGGRRRRVAHAPQRFIAAPPRAAVQPVGFHNGDPTARPVGPSNLCRSGRSHFGPLTGCYSHPRSRSTVHEPPLTVNQALPSQRLKRAQGRVAARPCENSCIVSLRWRF